MHRLTGVAAIAALLVLASCEQPGTSATAEATQSEAVTPANLAGVASVVDGDTIEIHGERIRLSGFDTPERGARCGDVNVYQRAANELDSFVAGRTVECTRRETDQYGRTVATCSVGGVDIGDYMVSHGWGRDWPQYSGGAYSDEETGARAEARGRWGLECPADLWGDRDYSP